MAFTKEGTSEITSERKREIWKMYYNESKTEHQISRVTGHSAVTVCYILGGENTEPKRCSKCRARSNSFSWVDPEECIGCVVTRGIERTKGNLNE